MDETADNFGTMTAGGILAREVERAHASGHDHAESCANCGTALTGPYCHVCGQQGHVHRTAGALLHDIAHGVFHFEGKVWATLPLLVLKPGELTRRYAQGERAKFVSPMALFLFTVFLLFATTSSITKHWDFGESGPDVARTIDEEEARLDARIRRLEAQVRERSARPPPREAAGRTERAEALAEMRRALVEAKQARARLRQAEAIVKPTAAGLNTAALAMETSGSTWLDKKIKDAQDNPRLMIYKIKTAAYKYSWALIPLSLPFIWILFPFRRGVGMYDHAIFATYSLSFVMLLGIALVLLSYTGVSAGWLWVAFVTIPVIHMYKQLRHAYVLGRFGAGWRTFALLSMTSVTSTLFFLLLLYLGIAG